MTSLECVAHYSSKDLYNSELINLSEHAYSRFLEAKEVRQGLGGKSEHKDQCSTIPSEIDKEVHRIYTNLVTKVYRYYF